MLLNSLTVAGLRCFRNPVTLTDFEEGVNIIFGPNETGKSTLVWGLVLAFCNRYDVGGEGILAYRPWGTDLSPAIEVEFTAAGKRYRLEKGFLDQAKCILSERAGDSYLRLADGKRADDRVREFMLARLPGRGLAKGPDWGLAHLLWMPQDKERFTSPSVSRQVEDHFRQAAGATLFTLRDDKLLELIDDRYAEVFTPKTGQILAKSELNQVRVERQQIEEKLQLTRDRLEAVCTKAAQLEKKEKQVQHWQRAVQELREKYHLLSAQVEEVKKLKAQITTAEAEQKAALERWRSLQQDWDHIEAWAEKSGEAARLVQQKEKELALLQPVVETLQQEKAIKQADVTRLAQEVKGTHQQLTRAYKLRQSLTQLAEINKMEQDLAVAKKIHTELMNREKELALSPVPSLDQVLQAEKQQRQIEIRQGQARTQGLQVDFKPVKAFAVTVITADGPEQYQVSTERPLSLNATGAEMQLKIADVGTFTIRSGAVELQEILSQLGAAKTKLAVILQTYQAGSVTELREKYDWTQNRRQQIISLQFKLADLLGKDNSTEQLQQDYDLKRQQLNQQCQELGVDAAGLSLVPLADVSQIEQQTKALQEAHEGAQKQLKVIEAEYQQKKSHQQTLEQEVNEYNRLIDTARGELEKRLVHYPGQKAELQQSLQRAKTEKEQKTHLLAQLKRELPPDADSLERTAARQKQELDQKQQAALKLREEVAGLRAEINLQSQEGLYSKIGELEEEYELVQSQYRWLAGQARAVKLLYRLVHARHETMLTSLTDPIRQGINGLCERVTAKTDRSLQLDADLSLAGLRIGSEQSLQPLDAFSIGAQEQMLLLARLALAHFLSASERQLVVLDDALVNSDGHRRQRILNLLNEAAADRLQLIILTCHPDMYRDLPGKRYDLASLA